MGEFRLKRVAELLREAKGVWASLETHTMRVKDMEKEASDAQVWGRLAH
jgi:hypothetical protein